MKTFVEYFFAIALVAAVAAGFVFLWHRWIRTRSPLSLVLAIVITVLVAVIAAFSIATLIIYLLSI